MKVVAGIKNTIEILGVACLALLIFVTVLAVCSRYALNAPLAWGEEIQMLLMIWAVMLGGIVAAWERRALAIDLIFSVLKKAGRRRLNRLISLITALTLGFLCPYGWALSKISRSKITNILHLPYSYLVWAVAVGALGISLVSLAHFFLPPEEGGPER